MKIINHSQKQGKISSRSLLQYQTELISCRVIHNLLKEGLLYQVNIKQFAPCGKQTVK